MTGLSTDEGVYDDVVCTVQRYELNSGVHVGEGFAYRDDAKVIMGCVLFDRNSPMTLRHATARLFWPFDQLNGI
jgi:hypothetical protein